MGGDWSAQVEIHFEHSLAWEGCGHHILRYIIFPQWHEMRFLSSLAWEEGYVKYILRCVSVLAGMGWG